MTLESHRLVVGYHGMALAAGLGLMAGVFLSGDDTWVESTARYRDSRGRSSRG